MRGAAHVLGGLPSQREQNVVGSRDGLWTHSR